MTIAKDATDNSKYQYSGYGICFDFHDKGNIGNIVDGKNVLIFGAVIPHSSAYNNNKTSVSGNTVYILGPKFGLVQKLNEKSLNVDKVYKTNFTQQHKKIVLSLHYNGDNSYLFVNGVQALKFKANESEIKRNHMYLGNVSKYFSVPNAARTGMYGDVYDSAVDYVATDVLKIYDIHRYLMKRNDIV